MILSSHSTSSKQLPGRLVVQLGYVGDRPTHLEVNHNIDLLPAQYYNQGAAGVTYLTTSVHNPMAGLIPGNSGLNGATVPETGYCCYPRVQLGYRGLLPDRHRPV